jgi:hypothetical protein
MAVNQQVRVGTVPAKMFDTPMVDNNGKVTKIWRYFLQNLPTSAIVPLSETGTQAQRAATSASGFPDGSTFYETDTSRVYRAQDGVWQYLGGGTAP